MAGRNRKLLSRISVLGTDIQGDCERRWLILSVIVAQLIAHEMRRMIIASRSNQLQPCGLGFFLRLLIEQAAVFLFFDAATPPTYDME